MLEYVPGVGLTPTIDEELYLREVTRLLDRVFETGADRPDTGQSPSEVPTTRDEDG